MISQSDADVSWARPPRNAARRAQAWVSTHAGVTRTANQDSFVCRSDAGLWMVADGVGGHLGGQCASRTVAAALGGIPADLGQADLLRATECALRETHDHLRRGSHMGATTVVTLVARGNRVTCLWAGDSRAYCFREHELRLLTRDHSLLQDMIAAGRVAPEKARNHPARNVITRAVGADCETLELDRLTWRAAPGDIYLLCSDGLTNALDEEDITGVLSCAPENAAAELIATAVQKRAQDNVTALVISLFAPNPAA